MAWGGPLARVSRDSIRWDSLDSKSKQGWFLALSKYSPAPLKRTPVPSSTLSILLSTCNIAKTTGYRPKSLSLPCTRFPPPRLLIPPRSLLSFPPEPASNTFSFFLKLGIGWPRTWYCTVNNSRCSIPVHEIINQASNTWILVGLNALSKLDLVQCISFRIERKRRNKQNENKAGNKFEQISALPLLFLIWNKNAYPQNSSIQESTKPRTFSQHSDISKWEPSFNTVKQ